MQSFVRAVERWVPDSTGSLLEFGGGCYENAPRFQAVSRDMCFGRGEGLPGRAWEQRRPIMLTDLQVPMFRRARAAAAEGLSCGVALPVFDGETLKAVVVFFCGDDDTHVGAIELWHHDAADSYDMVLDAGYYGGTAEVFEFVSRHTKFRRGTGLPGMVWDSERPVFLPDLGKSDRFLRADSARQVGINRGFALPCPVPGEDHYVLVFLSALATPIAPRIEAWWPLDDGSGLRRGEGFCVAEGVIEPGPSRVERGQGLIGQALADGLPALTSQAKAEPGTVGFTARGAELASLLALPLWRHGRVAVVLAWYF